MIYIIFLLFQSFYIQAKDTTIIQLEYGQLWATRNTFQIPNNVNNSRVNLYDISKKSIPTYRVNFIQKLNDHHFLRLLYAPVETEISTKLSEKITFQNQDYNVGESVVLMYKFNSYRLTYFYLFNFSNSIEIKLGFTGKIRDAHIGIDGKNGRNIKKDVGFVPLLHFGARTISEKSLLGLDFEIDGMAAPQGRAIDGSLKLLINSSEYVQLYIGYRVIEGGANNKNVYTFSTFQFALAGLQLAF